MTGTYTYCAVDGESLMEAANPYMLAYFGRLVILKVWDGESYEPSINLHGRADFTPEGYFTVGNVRLDLPPTALTMEITLCEERGAAYASFNDLTPEDVLALFADLDIDRLGLSFEVRSFNALGVRVEMDLVFACVDPSGMILFVREERYDPKITYSFREHYNPGNGGEAITLLEITAELTKGLGPDHDVAVALYRKDVEEEPAE
jgi:hypothetical protein